MPSKNKILIFIHQGCCRSVFAEQPVDVEVIDLDGDYREEGQQRLAKIEETGQFGLTQTWP